MNKKKLIGFVTMMCMMLLLTGSIYAKNYDLGSKTVTFVDAIQFSQRGKEGRFAGRLDEVEEKYNVNLDLISTGEAWNSPEGKIARLMGGEASLDIWDINEWKYFPLLEMGGLYPLNDALDEVLGSDPYSEYTHAVQLKSNMLDHQGVNYTMFRNSAGSPTFCYFNKSIIEEQGLTNPYDLYKEGKWTWDNFVQIAEAATKDRSGDGQTDQWGVYMHSFHAMHMNQPEIIKEKDGRYVFDPGNKLIQALNLGQKLFQSGARIYDNQLQRFGQGEILFAIAPVWKISRVPQDLRVGIVPAPKMPQADSYVNMTNTTRFFALPVSSAKPEALVALFHDIYRKGDVDESVKDMQMGVSEDPTAAKVIKEAIYEYPIGYRYLGYPFLGDIIYDLQVDSVVHGESPAELIEKFKPVAQELIDKNLNFDSAFSE